jgi:cell division transport system permease protein
MSRWLNHHLQAIKLVLKRMGMNALSTFIICLVIAVALCLPSLFYLCVDNLAKLGNHMQSETEISLFLKHDASQENIRHIKSRLSQHPDINQFHFVTKDEAWQQMQLQSASNPDISNAIAQLGSNPLPDAFFIQAKSIEPSQLETLRDNLQQMAGVEQALLNADWAKRLATILNLGQQFVLFVGLLLAIVLLVVIGNTIRMQILTQKTEIEVSYLIGATHSFIKVPFLYAGVFYGLFGGILSALIIGVMIFSFNESVTEISQLYGSDFKLNLLNIKLYLGIIGIAVVTGWIGAYVAVSRAIKQIKLQ